MILMLVDLSGNFNGVLCIGCAVCEGINFQFIF